MPNSKKNIKRKKNENKRRRIFTRVVLMSAAFFAVIFAFGLAGALAVTYNHAQDAPDFQPEQLQPSLTSSIYDSDGRELTAVHGEQNRVEISLQDLPGHVTDAFLAVEDRRFYSHPGVDLYAIARAAWVNLVNLDLREQGGSTITQQLARNAFLSSEQTLSRKIQEAWLALQMERYYVKEEILEKYLNHVYFGGGAYGVEAAAQLYFEKSAEDLSPAEAAMLAGIVRSPTYYSPYENKEYALGRQQLVLSLMEEGDFISQETWEEARQEELEIAPKPDSEQLPYPYYVDYVIHRELLEILADEDFYGSREAAYEAIYTDGLQVYTAIQPELQGAVEEVLENEELYPQTWRIDAEYLDVLKEDDSYQGYPEEYLGESGVPQPQSAAVVADPETGAMKALVGGREYSEDNRSLRYVSPRQPGSAIKPILAYVPAMEEGGLVPSTVIDDAPFAQGDWTPENFDRRFRGLVNAREALVRSLNVPAVKTFKEISPEAGLEYGEKMGLTTIHPHDATLAAVLGGMTHGTTALDMAQAFAVLANEGIREEFHAIEKIKDRHGEVVYEQQEEPKAVLSGETAYLINDILQDVAGYGTAAGLESDYNIAAKTGTTSDNRDAWLLTYSPDFVISFWMGHDVQRLGRIDGGSSTTVPFMNAILPAVEEITAGSEFSRPEGIGEPVAVCSKSGLRPGDDCPSDSIVYEVFPRGEAPAEECELHEELEVCKSSGLLPGPYCPEDELEKETFLNRPEYKETDERWRSGAGRGPEDARKLPPEEECDEHTEKTILELLEIDFTAQYFPFSAEISWVYDEDFDPEEFLEGYRLLKKEAGEEEHRVLGTFSPDTEQKNDQGVEPGEEYVYKVEILGLDGDVLKEIQESVTLPGEDDLPPGFGEEENGEENGEDGVDDIDSQDNGLNGFEEDDNNNDEDDNEQEE